MKIHRSWVILFVYLCISSCVGKSYPSTNATEETLPNNKFSTPTISSQSTTQTHQFSSSDDLNEEVLQEVSFFAGGAGCGIQNIGVSGKICMVTTNWPVTLRMTGIFRVSAQGGADQYPWWGEKTDSCYENLQFGDMVYFVAYGYPYNETVQFKIQGPNGTETYTSPVQNNIQYTDQKGSCSLKADTAGARLAWVANPTLGVGEYRVTVSGTEGKAELIFNVSESKSPSFGISVGSSSLPLVMGPEKEIKLVYTGFDTHQIVRTLLYSTNNETYSSDLVRYVDVEMDTTGSAILKLNWDTSLPSGKYWLLVPETLPKVSPTKYYGITPAFYAIYFFVDTASPYTTENLTSAFQDIILRSSCDTDISLQSGRPINFKYGFWGVNGLDLLESTKNKIITRLFINNEEIIGYRSSQAVSMTEMPCGNYLENGYFIHSESQLGPFRDGDILDIKVEYSFIESITDGYDFSPKDGIQDVFSPSTPFTQTYTIKIVP